MWEKACADVDMQDEGSTALMNVTNNCLVLQDRDGKTALNIGKK